MLSQTAVNNAYINKVAEIVAVFYDIDNEMDRGKITPEDAAEQMYAEFYLDVPKLDSPEERVREVYSVYNDIANDLARGKATPLEAAEQIYAEFGCRVPDICEECGEIIETGKVTVEYTGEDIPLHDCCRKSFEEKMKKH